MSRGPGRLQRDILDAVKLRPGTTLEALRWEMCPTAVPPTGRLPGSWNSSFSRAVESLRQRGHLVVEDRALADLDEWQSHYPGKALHRATRELRLQLLPELVAWINSGEGPNPRYSAAENERFVAKRIDREEMAALALRWRKLERQLRPLLASSESNHLFLLIARGKQLFETVPVTTRTSLRELYGICESGGLLPPDVSKQVKEFVEEFLPELDAGALGLKSYIHAISRGIPKHGHCELGDDALDALHRRKRALLESLPGFQPAPPKGRGLFVGRWGPKHSPMLKKVIDQSVFHDFKFLKVA